MKTATMLGSFAALAVIFVGGAMAEPQRQFPSERDQQSDRHTVQERSNRRLDLIDRRE